MWTLSFSFNLIKGNNGYSVLIELQVDDDMTKAKRCYMAKLSICTKADLIKIAFVTKSLIWKTTLVLLRVWYEISDMFIFGENFRLCTDWLMAYSYIQKEKEAYQIFAVSCGYEVLKLITLGQTISLFSTFDLSTFSTTLPYYLIKDKLVRSF